MRKALAAFGFVSGVAAGSVIFRRSFARRPERVDVYFDDGTMVSYVDGSPEASAFLPAARAAVAAARA